MRDTQSKIQDWINDIPTGFGGGTRLSADLSCKEQGHAPEFHNGAGGAGANKGDCIYLGKAIQFTDKNSPPSPGQESQIYAYNVFGLREFDPGGGADKLPVANMEQAKPRAIVDYHNYSGDGDLTDEYTIPGGARVKSIMSPSSGTTSDSHMAGFYLSFNQLKATNSGSASVKSYQYRLPGNHLPGNYVPDPGNNDRDVDTCIALDNNHNIDCTIPGGTPEDSWPEPLVNWQICFDNDYNDDTAVLTISSIGGSSVSTKLEFKEC